MYICCTSRAFFSAGYGVTKHQEPNQTSMQKRKETQQRNSEKKHTPRSLVNRNGREPLTTEPLTSH